MANVHNEMRVAQEEIFGPVACLIPFEGETQAEELANANPYGLSAYIWTNNVGRAHRLAYDLDVGMIWINSQITRHLNAPFGGTKASGFGREGGEYSLETYTNVKNICVALGTHDIPKWGIE